MVEGIFFINVFNEACKNIAASYLRVGYESVSEIRFCTTSRANYLTCPLFYAIHNHQGKSSILRPVMLLGHLYSYIYIEGSKG